jgi:flagellar biosynthesis/type III secretory pathway protein FliH
LVRGIGKGCEQRAFAEQLAKIEPKQEKSVMEIVTSWMREGIQIGRQEGKQEGKQEEAVSIITRMLTRRFGSLTPQLHSQIQNLSVTQLEDLCEALFDFTAIADLETWLGE